MATFSGNVQNIDANLYNLTPELIDENTLLRILESRCIKVANLKSMTKDQLLIIFQRMIPLPQRTHRRGKQLKRVRKKSLISDNLISVRFDNIGTSPCTSTTNQTPALDRLKPPPDAINYGRKKITLNHVSLLKSNDSSDLDKIIIKDRTKSSKRVDDVSHVQTKLLKVENKDEKMVCEPKHTIISKSTDSVKSCAIVGEQSLKLPSKRVKLKRSSTHSCSEGDAQSSSAQDEESKKLKSSHP